MTYAEAKEKERKAAARVQLLTGERNAARKKFWRADEALKCAEQARHELAMDCIRVAYDEALVPRG